MTRRKMNAHLAWLAAVAWLAACAGDADADPEVDSGRDPSGGASQAEPPLVELDCARGQLRLAGTLDGQSVDVTIDNAIASFGSGGSARQPAALIFDEESVQLGMPGYLELHYTGGVYTTARKSAQAAVDLSRLGAGVGRYGNCEGERLSSLVVGDTFKEVRFALRGQRHDADCAMPQVSGELSGCYWQASDE